MFLLKVLDFFVKKKKESKYVSRTLSATVMLVCLHTTMFSLINKKSNLTTHSGLYMYLDA